MEKELFMGFCSSVYVNTHDMYYLYTKLPLHTVANIDLRQLVTDLLPVMWKISMNDKFTVRGTRIWFTMFRKSSGDFWFSDLNIVTGSMRTSLKTARTSPIHILNEISNEFFYPFEYRIGTELLYIICLIVIFLLFSIEI